MRRLIGKLATLVMTASLLTVVPVGTASADTIPPTQFDKVVLGSNVGKIVTDPAGNVTSACTTYNGGQDLTTYSPTGAIVRQLSRTSQIDGVTNCITQPEVDKNGDLYGIPDGGSGRGPNLLAYRGNTLKWKYPLACGYSQGAQYVVGATGNIYATVHGGDGVHLIGLTPNVSPGQTQPTKVLDIKVDDNLDCSTMLRPYRDGIVLHGQLGGGARYYSYGGKYLGTTPGNIWYEKINADGWNFTANYVQGNYVSGTVTAFNPKTGLTWTTPVSNPGANVQMIKVIALAGGGVLAYTKEQKMDQGLPVVPTTYVAIHQTFSPAPKQLY
jgi:hypothetical protein